MPNNNSDKSIQSSISKLSSEITKNAKSLDNFSHTIKQLVSIMNAKATSGSSALSSNQSNLLARVVGEQQSTVSLSMAKIEKYQGIMNSSHGNSQSYKTARENIDVHQRIIQENKKSISQTSYALFNRPGVLASNLQKREERYLASPEYRENLLNVARTKAEAKGILATSAGKSRSRWEASVEYKDLLKLKAEAKGEASAISSTRSSDFASAYKLLNIGGSFLAGAKSNLQATSGEFGILKTHIEEFRKAETQEEREGIAQKLNSSGVNSHNILANWGTVSSINSGKVGKAFGDYLGFNNKKRYDFEGLHTATHTLKHLSGSSGLSIDSVINTLKKDSTLKESFKKVVKANPDESEEGLQQFTKNYSILDEKFAKMANSTVLLTKGLDALGKTVGAVTSGMVSYSRTSNTVARTGFSSLAEQYGVAGMQMRQVGTAVTSSMGGVGSAMEAVGAGMAMTGVGAVPSMVVGGAGALLKGSGEVLQQGFVEPYAQRQEYSYRKSLAKSLGISTQTALQPNLNNITFQAGMRPTTTSGFGEVANRLTSTAEESLKTQIGYSKLTNSYYGSAQQALGQMVNNSTIGVTMGLSSQQANSLNPATNQLLGNILNSPYLQKKDNARYIDFSKRMAQTRNSSAIAGYSGYMNRGLGLHYAEGAISKAFLGESMNDMLGKSALNRGREKFKEMDSNTKAVIRQLAPDAYSMVSQEGSSNKANDYLKKLASSAEKLIEEMNTLNTHFAHEQDLKRAQNEGLRTLQPYTGFI